MLRVNHSPLTGPSKGEGLHAGGRIMDGPDPFRGHRDGFLRDGGSYVTAPQSTKPEAGIWSPLEQSLAGPIKTLAFILATEESP